MNGLSPSIRLRQSEGERAGGPPYLRAVLAVVALAALLLLTA